MPKRNRRSLPKKKIDKVLKSDTKNSQIPKSNSWLCLKEFAKLTFNANDLIADFLVLGNGSALAAKGVGSNRENHLGEKIRFNHLGASLNHLATKALTCFRAELASISIYANKKSPDYR